MIHTRTRSQKRQWEINRRMKCHGTTESCIREHGHSVPSPFFEVQPVKKLQVNKREGKFSKVLKWLNLK